METTKKEINENLRFKKNSRNDRFYTCEIKKEDSVFIFEFETHLFDPTFCNRVFVTIDTETSQDTKKIGESISSKKEAINEIYEFINYLSK